MIALSLVGIGTGNDFTAFIDDVQLVYTPATPTTLSAAPNPSAFGSAVTFTATVEPSALDGTTKVDFDAPATCLPLRYHWYVLVPPAGSPVTPSVLPGAKVPLTFGENAACVPS